VLDRSGQGIEHYRDANPKMHEIPFNSSNKWQMSIHSMATLNGRQVLLLKGAPDVLLSKCSHYLNSDGAAVPIDRDFIEIYTKAYEHFGSQGERVLGFSMKLLNRSVEEEELADPRYKDKLKDGLVGRNGSGSATGRSNGSGAGRDSLSGLEGLLNSHGSHGSSSVVTNDLVFVGLITLIDPPRPEVPQAVKDCQTAGVKVVMVTGDHPLTAEAIARKIGLITLPLSNVLDDKLMRATLKSMYFNSPTAEIPYAVVVHGTRIETMNEDDWKLVVRMKEIVFARTSPEQKLTIVKQFTDAGNVTAMTGDGVNDAPALKQAAIGVAMGMNGSDVAREAADIVLLDDNFASIVVGIKEGRLLFANLKKSIAYTLTHTMPEVYPVLLFTVFGWPEPINAIMLLLIDLLTELLPALSLAFEKPEKNIMNIPPRNVHKEKLVSIPLLAYSYFQAGTVITVCCLYVYFKVRRFKECVQSQLK
jgi:sodium/potassium-transporting ATPase subunit alpha